MAYYYTCEYCGANLDPDERCDCRDRVAKAGRKTDYAEAMRNLEEWIRVNSNSQAQWRHAG